MGKCEWVSVMYGVVGSGFDPWVRFWVVHLSRVSVCCVLSSRAFLVMRIILSFLLRSRTEAYWELYIQSLLILSQ